MVKSRALRAVGALALVISAGVGARSVARTYRDISSDAVPGQRVPPRPRPAEPRRAPAAPDLDSADARCLERRRQLLAVAAEPEVSVNRPALRVQLLGRAKAEPVVFRREPKDADLSALVVHLRQTLELGHARAISDVLSQVKDKPVLARRVFLREGYLYSDRPELWPELGALGLSRLFDEPALRIERGPDTLRVTAGDDGEYRYTDGKERGQRAKLLLFDRVSLQSEPPRASLHVDVRQLQDKLGFHHLRIERMTSQGVLASLDYGAFAVPAVLDFGGKSAELVCEAPGPLRDALRGERHARQRSLRAQARLLSAVEAQIAEGLPFDEPRTEEGQQDGKLRPEWRLAYREGRTSFEFNGDRYAVFDASGRPRPPQVCIDFVLDTFERASGTWWQPRGGPRTRLRGGVAFDDEALDNRRSVERFIEYARIHREAFEVDDVPAGSRVEFRHRQRFFEQVLAQGARYRLGDIIAILGLRSDDKFHYHSFIVVDVDPLSGAPTRLAANAGRPRIRTWEGEMSSAPKRSVVARVRPRPEWLASWLGPGETLGSAPQSPF